MAYFIYLCVCVFFAGNTSLQRRMPMVKPQICFTLKRNLLGFASTFTKRNVEGNVRGITRDHVSAFAGRTAQEGEGKGKV
jgi:hypothetical protein